MNPAPPRRSVRKYRRIQSPLNVSFDGQIHRALDWSPGGILLDIPGARLAKDRLESAELLLPCADGVQSAPVTLRPVREIRTGWGCDFIDLTPRTTAILAAYADAMIHGFSITLAELERAGKNPLDADAAHLLEEPPHSPPAIFWSRFPLKRLLFAFVFLLLIAAIGSLVVPFFAHRFLSRMKEGDGYLEVANSRLRTAQITIEDLDAKIRTVRSILDPSTPGASRLPISPEQKRMLELGLAQLENERRMVNVHMDIFRTNIAAIRKGDYFFEQAVLHNYGTESHTDAAPYITQILTDIAVSSRVEPHTDDDIRKYLLVARARVQQAEFELQSSQVQRAALEKILARATGQKQSGALPYNSIELMQRDIALLRLDEARLEQMLTVLRDNVAAVQKGNFMYETNLLQRFDPQPLRTTSPNDSALTH